MKRIETSIENVKKEIGDFYKADRHHFIVMNAVDLGDKSDGHRIEVQWFFSDYAPPYEITIFCTQILATEEIPSLKDIISSAWVAEAELVDLIDIKIENTDKGFVLEPDSEEAPLRKSK